MFTVSTTRHLVNLLGIQLDAVAQNDDDESVFLEFEVNFSAELCVDDVYTSAFLCTRVCLEDQIVFCLKQLWFFIELLQEYFNHGHDRILNLLHEDQDWFVSMC